MEIENLCKLNCIHKDKCNKKFARILSEITENVVYLYAECGATFRCEDKEDKEEK